MASATEATSGLASRSLPVSPTHEELLADLVTQLGFPSFVVPVAHPYKPGSKAYAQALFLPATASHLAPSVFEALRGSGQILDAPGVTEQQISDCALSLQHNLIAVLVLRPDDPARSAASHAQL